MAQSKTAGPVFIPEPGLLVQTATSDEYPGGQVLHLQPGWTDVGQIDPALADHPILSRMATESPDENKRRMDMANADRERAEARSKLDIDFYEKAVKSDEGRMEQIRQLENERAQRLQEASDRGITRNEPHPDPMAQHAIALTQGPGYQLISAAGQASKVEPPHPPPAQPRGEQQQREAGEPTPANPSGGRRTTV